MTRTNNNNRFYAVSIDDAFILKRWFMSSNFEKCLPVYQPISIPEDYQRLLVHEVQ